MRGTTIGCMYIVLISFVNKDSSDFLFQEIEHQIERHFPMEACVECIQPQTIAPPIATDVAFCRRKLLFDCQNPLKYPIAQQLIKRIADLGLTFPGPNIDFTLQIVRVNPLVQ